MTPTALIVGLVVTAAIAAGLYAALPRGVRTFLRRGWRGIRRAGRSATRSARRVAALVAVFAAVVAYVVWPEPWWAASACAAVAFLVAATAAGRLRLVTSSPATVVALVAAAVPAALPYAGEVGVDLGELASHIRWAGPTAVLVAALAGATATAGAGFLIGRGGRVSARTVAGGLRVAPDALRPEGEPLLRVHADKRTGVVTAGPVPLAHRARMLAAVELLEQLHPGFSVSADPAAGTLTFTPTGEDTLASRELLAASGGLVAREAPAESTPWRPDAIEVHAPDGGWRGGQVAGLEDYAATAGRTLVHVDLDRGVALAARIPARVRELRGELAPLHGWRPTDLELQARPGADGRPVELVVHRAPVIADPERRVETWTRALGDAIRPGAGERWSVTDLRSGRIRAVRAADPLRTTVPYPADAVPTYKAIPFGVDEDGQPVTLGLIEVNALVGGVPGGGKSGGLTALLRGISQLPHVAIIGLDPKRVEQAEWAPRFSRIARPDDQGGQDDATVVLKAVMQEVLRRYQWLESQGLKKVRTDMLSGDLPLIVLAVDELADLVAVGGTKEEKAAEEERATLLRRTVALGRAAGVVVITATQKPQSDVVPTALRDLIQLRVGYATTTPQMTETILGAGMAQVGGLSHEIPTDMPGTCYVVSESSRTPRRCRTYWIPDEDVAGLAAATAHLRVDLPWMPPPGGEAPVTAAEPTTSRPDHTVVPEEVEIDPIDLSWDDLAGLDLGGPIT